MDEDEPIEVLSASDYHEAFEDSVGADFSDELEVIVTRLYGGAMMRETLRIAETFSADEYIDAVHDILSDPANLDEYRENQDQASVVGTTLDLEKLYLLDRSIELQRNNIIARKRILLDEEGYTFFSINYFDMLHRVFSLIPEGAERQMKILTWQEVMVLKFYISVTDLVAEDVDRTIDRIIALRNAYERLWTRTVDGVEVFVRFRGPPAPPVATKYSEDEPIEKKFANLFF